MSKKEEQRIDQEIHRVARSHDPFAAAVRTTRMPMLITDPSQPDNPIVFANDAFSRLTGYAREEIMGQNCRFLQGTGTSVDDITKVRNAIARREAIEIDLLNYRKDGTTFWNRVLISPVFDDDGKLTYFFASQFDVTPERRRLAELHDSHSELEGQVEKRVLDLTASENRLRFILNAASMGTWTLELDNERLICSARCKENFGREPNESFSYADLKAAIEPEDFERWQSAVTEAIANHGEFQVEYRIRTPKGERRWIEVRGQHLSSDGSQVRIMTGITQDITERKEAEEHRKLLARELNHRVKNSLATVQSIVSRSLSTANSLEEAKAIVFGRIGAMAAAQDVLTLEGWRSADLKALVYEALKPFQGADIRIGGPRVVLNEQAVSALSLAIYELATNASKYGALSSEAGSVTIHWEVLPGNPQKLKFHWSEMGGPSVVPPSRKGFGTRLVEGVVSAALGGTAKINYRPAGVLYEIEAALPDEQLGSTEN